MRSSIVPSLHTLIAVSRYFLLNTQARKLILACVDSLITSFCHRRQHVQERRQHVHERHGCPLFDDGAQRPASKIAVRSSVPSFTFDSNARGLQRSASTGWISTEVSAGLRAMLIFILLLIVVGALFLRTLATTSWTFQRGASRPGPK